VDDGDRAVSCPPPGSGETSTATGVADAVFRGGADRLEDLDGQLIAVGGRAGNERSAVADRTLDLHPPASPALGDPRRRRASWRSFALAEQGTQLLAFEADGTSKWRSPSLLAHAGAAAPFLVDLDGDGRAEVLIGKEVLNGTDGTLRWRGAGTKADDRTSRVCTRSPWIWTGTASPRWVAGSSAYRADGTLLWDAASVPDGVAAAADLDGELISGDRPRGRQAAGSWSTTAPWRGVRWTCPARATRGRPPWPTSTATARAEIGRRRPRDLFRVRRLRESRRTNDQRPSSNPDYSTGGAASAFDLDGDGAAELVIARSRRPARPARPRRLRRRRRFRRAPARTATATRGSPTWTATPRPRSSSARTRPVRRAPSAVCGLRGGRGRLGALAPALEPVRIRA